MEMEEEERGRGLLCGGCRWSCGLTQIQQYIRFWVVCVLLMVTAPLADEFLWLSFI